MYAQKNWTMAARLAPDISQEQAQAALSTVATRHAELPRLTAVQLDARLLAFTLTLSLLCGLFFGLAPSWRPVRNRLSAALKEG